MKKIILLFYYAFSILLFSEEKSLYDDISKEHWAYRAIENLTKKGIFDQEDKNFAGDKKLSRFEFAHYLSKVLNEIDAEKASRSDILILENIVYEFSQELNKIGFDSKLYIETLDNLQKRVTQNELNAKKNQEILNDINIRLKELEQNSSKSQQYIDRKSLFSNKLKYFQNFNLFLESGISYNPGSSSDDVEEDKYKGNYTLGMGFTEENFELIIESETSDETDTSGELVVKGQLATELNIMGGSTLSYHTKGYERYYRSYFNHVIYDNHSSYQYVKVSNTDEDYNENKIGTKVSYYEPTNGEIAYKEDEFNSYGLTFENDYLTLLVEKNGNVDSDYDKRGLTNASGNIAYSDTIVFFGQAKGDYYELTLMKNGNNSNGDYQLIGKYPDKNFDLRAGLLISQRDTNEDIQKYSGYTEINTYDFEVNFGNFRQFTVGMEMKDGEQKLYEDYYASLRYLLTDIGVIKYKVENLSTSNSKNYFNHYFLFNFSKEKLKTYFSYNIISIYKDGIVNSESLEENDYLVNGIKTRIKDYDEFLVKAEYEFNEKLKGILGYYMKDYEENSDNEDKSTSSDITDAEEAIVFFQFSYDLSENIKTYLRYLENNGEDRSDRVLDINNDMIDIDFDSSTGVIRNSPDGTLEIGVEIKF